MKFVIYGAGHRGKRLLNYLGDDTVVAFIDSSSTLIGTEYRGIPIISLGEYKLRFNDIEIIVSPVNYREINNELKYNDIYNYSNLNDLPSEFSGYGNQRFLNCYASLIKVYNAPCYILGRTAFSRLLYEALEKKGNRVSWVDGILKQEEGIMFITQDEDLKKINKTYPQFELIDAYDYSSNLEIYNNEKVKKIKGKYVDKKRCFIVATGPSLKREDLDKLKEMQEFTISMNRIYNMKPLWYSDIYVICDSVLMKEDAEIIRNYKAPLKFYSDANDFPGDDGIVIHTVATSFNKYPRFSEDVAQKVYGGGTVTYACIQIAVYLGFKEIYLLGVDCKYEYRSTGNHFYKVSSEDKLEHNTDGMIKAFESAKKYADENGIKIYNATRGGALEVFDRVDFDALFEK